MVDHCAACGGTGHGTLRLFPQDHGGEIALCGDCETRLLTDLVNREPDLTHRSRMGEIRLRRATRLRRRA